MVFSYSPYSTPSSSPAGSYSSYSPADASNSNKSYTQASCAFPSWPRRSSLDNVASPSHASSYVSDDDLFPEVFDDTEPDCTPVTSPCRSPQLAPASLKYLTIVTTDVWKELLGDAQAAREQSKAKKSKKRRSGSSKKSSRSMSGRTMSPIPEGEAD